MQQQDLLGGVDQVAVAPRPARSTPVDAHAKLGFAAALALVVEHGKKAPDRAAVPPRTRCPRCEQMGDTVRDFGIRFVRGRRIPQSWCRTCRSAQGARLRPQQKDLLSSSAA